MSTHCEGGRKGHHHFQASLGLDDSYAIRKVMWIFQQPSNHPKNGLKLFLKDSSYLYAPGFSRDINVQGVLALCEFHYCEFHYFGFSKLSINICLMWILDYFISLVRFNYHMMFFCWSIKLNFVDLSLHYWNLTGKIKFID